MQRTLPPGLGLVVGYEAGGLMGALPDPMLKAASLPQAPGPRPQAYPWIPAGSTFMGLDPGLGSPAVRDSGTVGS